MITILYVDDEPGLLEITKIYLERSGEFSVSTSLSAQDVLDSPTLMSCDAIISDYQMPGMDGIAFLKTVRKQFGDIPFILFTGRGREEVVIEAINNGADFYVQKGGDPKSQFAELIYKIKTAVERKQVHDALRENKTQIRDNQNLFQQFLNTIPLGVWIADRKGKLIFGNPAGQQIWATDLSEGPQNYSTLKAWHLPEHIPVSPGDWALRHAIDEGRVTSYEMLEIEALDGARKCIANWAAPVRDTNGDIIGAFVIELDITGRIRDKNESDRNTCRHETPLQGLPFPAFVIGKDHRVISWNPALEEFCGVSRDKVLGKAEAWRAFYPLDRPTLADLIVTENPDEIQLWYKENASPSLLTKGAYTVTEFFPDLNGGSWIIVTATPIHGETGQITGAVEVLQDITGKKRYGEQSKDCLRTNAVCL
jgi:PAS domain-containing protein